MNDCDKDVSALPMTAMDMFYLSSYDALSPKQHQLKWLIQRETEINQLESYSICSMYNDEEMMIAADESTSQIATFTPTDNIMGSAPCMKRQRSNDSADLSQKRLCAKLCEASVAAQGSNIMRVPIDSPTQLRLKRERNKRRLNSSDDWSDWPKQKFPPFQHIYFF